MLGRSGSRGRVYIPTMLPPSQQAIPIPSLPNENLELRHDAGSIRILAQLETMDSLASEIAHIVCRLTGPECSLSAAHGSRAGCMSLVPPAASCANSKKNSKKNKAKHANTSLPMAVDCRTPQEQEQQPCHPSTAKGGREGKQLQKKQRFQDSKTKIAVKTERPAPRAPVPSARVACRFFLRGRCKHGSKCNFLHSKPQACRFWQQWGQCSRGKKCRFAHDDHQ